MLGNQGKAEKQLLFHPPKETSDKTVLPFMQSYTKLEGYGKGGA
jgi:hypothetical protein